MASDGTENISGQKKIFSAVMTVQKKTPAPSPELAFSRSSTTGVFPSVDLFQPFPASVDQLCAKLSYEDEREMNGKQRREELFSAVMTLQKKTPAPSPELAFSRSSTTEDFPPVDLFQPFPASVDQLCAKLSYEDEREMNDYR